VSTSRTVQCCTKRFACCRGAKMEVRCHAASAGSCPPAGHGPTSVNADCDMTRRRAMAAHGLRVGRRSVARGSHSHRGRSSRRDVAAGDECWSSNPHRSRRALRAVSRRDRALSRQGRRNASGSRGSRAGQRAPHSQRQENCLMSYSPPASPAVQESFPVRESSCRI
jgi:hypothetical protein